MMKQTRSLWLAGLALTVFGAVAAWWYSVNYTQWNVPLYGASIALIFLLGGAMFALLAAAKKRTKKRVITAALLGGLGTVVLIFAVSYLINVVLLHEQGAKYASLATAFCGFLIALFGVLRLKTHTKTKGSALPLLGAVLALSVFAGGFAGTLPSDFYVPAKYSAEKLRLSAARELAALPDGFSGPDSFNTPDGTLSVAFIGGSLTQGRITYKDGVSRSTNAWTDDVLQFLAEKYPQKTLRAINAGKGGTTSQYGAMRFAYDVEPYAPDLLFIEFSVNDTGAFSAEPDETGTAETQKYLEYMIRRCLQMQKTPAVVYLHTPEAVDTNTELYGEWRAGAEMKNALCDYYGVPVIDIYDSLHKQYESAGTSLPLADWLAENGWYKRTEGGGLDVHPTAEGYRQFYSAAVVGALEQSWDKLIRLPAQKPPYCEKETAFLNATFSYVTCSDPRISYSGRWHISKNRLAAWLDPSADAIPNGFYELPHFPEGVAQIKNASGAYFSYETDADEILLAVVSSTKGLAASVSGEDGTVYGAVSCGSPYGNMDYPTASVKLPGDGKQHRITFRTDSPNGDETLFRFGYIIELRY